MSVGDGIKVHLTYDTVLLFSRNIANELTGVAEIAKTFNGDASIEVENRLFDNVGRSYRRTHYAGVL